MYFPMYCFLSPDFVRNLSDRVVRQNNDVLASFQGKGSAVWRALETCFQSSVIEKLDLASSLD